MTLSLPDNVEASQKRPDDPQVEESVLLRKMKSSKFIVFFIQLEYIAFTRTVNSV